MNIGAINAYSTFSYPQNSGKTSPEVPVRISSLASSYVAARQNLSSNLAGLEEQQALLELDQKFEDMQEKMSSQIGELDGFLAG